MPEFCSECGAPLPDGGSCRDHFHALLLLEGEIPGVAGSILHFNVADRPIPSQLIVLSQFAAWAAASAVVGFVLIYFART